MQALCCRFALWFLIVIGGLQIAIAQSPNINRIVDLTHPFNSETIYWPTEAGFKLERGAAGVTERGYFYAANRFTCAEHGGTHIDAPQHFWQGGQTVDQIPLERLVGPAVCVDVSQKCTADRDYQGRAEDFLAWESAHGESLGGGSGGPCRIVAILED